MKILLFFVLNRPAPDGPCQLVYAIPSMCDILVTRLLVGHRPAGLSSPRARPFPNLATPGQTASASRRAARLSAPPPKDIPDQTNHPRVARVVVRDARPRVRGFAHAGHREGPRGRQQKSSRTHPHPRRPGTHPLPTDPPRAPGGEGRGSAERRRAARSTRASSLDR